MAPNDSVDLYPQDLLEVLVQSLAEGDGVEVVDAALEVSPGDPRLHFLRGSVLAGTRRYPEARQAMGRAIELAPEYAVARFQLGFLEFTSGEAGQAARTWAPLEALPEGHAFRQFVGGLMRLPADDIGGAIERLRAGIAANDQIPALNRDMQLLIDELLGASSPDEEPTSETEMLLRQLGAGTKH